MVQFIRLRGDVGLGPGRVLSRTTAPRRSCFLSARLSAWYLTLHIPLF